MKVNFISGANIQIGGEIGKYNTIPIDFLVKISQNLQSILLTIAKFDIPSEESIDLDNFKIELSGFKTGCAIPQFVFTKRVQSVIDGDVSRQRKLVNNKFNRLMKVSDKGDYNELKDIYKEPLKRNHIIEEIYKLTTDFGNTPVSFIYYQKDKIQPIYEVKALKSKTKKELIVEIKKPEQLYEFEEQFGVARVKFSTKDGKKLKKPSIQEIYTKKTVSLDYSPEIIVVGKKVYNLSFPLRCLFEKEDDFYIIKSELIDIIGTGKTEDEAEQNFAEEFDFIYNRYNELQENKLSDRIKIIKTFLNYIVKDVE